MAKGRQSDQTVKILPHGARRRIRVAAHIRGVPGRRRNVQMSRVERWWPGGVVGQFESHR